MKLKGLLGGLMSVKMMLSIISEKDIIKTPTEGKKTFERFVFFTPITFPKKI